MILGWICDDGRISNFTTECRRSTQCQINSFSRTKVDSTVGGRWPSDHVAIVAVTQRYFIIQMVATVRGQCPKRYLWPLWIFFNRYF